MGTAGAGGRKRRKDRNPKGRDKIRVRKIEEKSRGEAISRTNGKIRSKDGPGKSRRDLAENKDPRQKGTKEETMGRRIRRKKRLEQVDMSARYFVKKKRGSEASLLSGLIFRKKDKGGLKGCFRISARRFSFYPVPNFEQIVNK